MAGQSGKAKLWELANYGSIPESLVFRLHYTRLVFAVNSFVPFCSFRSPNQQFWFSDSGADSAPLARAEGADGVSPRPLRRHAAGETLRGAHGPRRRGEHPRDTSSRSRSNPTALPAKRLSQDTASPATDPRPADDILFPPSRTRISRAWRWTPTTIRCSWSSGGRDRGRRTSDPRRSTGPDARGPRRG